MDAIVGVWLTSLLGATAFSAAGYILGQRGVYIPLLGLVDPARASEPERASTRPDVHTMPTPAAGIPRAELVAPEAPKESTPPSSPSSADTAGEAASAAAIAASQRPTAISAIPREEPDEEAANVATAATTLPATRTRSLEIGGDESAANTELKEALAKADAAAERARAAEAVTAELERQIATLRAELRNEVAARATATARADELGDRLASASEEAASLRHRVSLLDKQTKQLREALQGRVRALTTSEWQRRRDLEEAEEVRLKLRDVYEKLERSSLPPSTTSSPPRSASLPPTSTSVPPGKTTAPQMAAVSVGSLPPNGDEIASLREEVTRLSKENRDLRERALGSMPPKRSDVQDVDVNEFRALLERVGAVAGMKGAAIADETGSLLLGSGEHAESLAAFGAYIRDASSRTDRLLPLEGVEEVDIRDRGGMLLSTRVVSRSPAEVCLVLLGAADASLMTAKKIVKEHLRSRDAG